jgi:hypothetical protein
MIYDNAPQFNLDYSLFGIKVVKTSSIQAPKMNAIVERFCRINQTRSIRLFYLSS